MLFCIDFDNTLVKAHFHNILSTARIRPDDPKTIVKILQLIADEATGPKNSPQMLEFMRSALQNGHNIAITTFSSYLTGFLPTLQAIGLSAAEIDQIIFIPFLPKDRAAGKNEHIALAMKRFNIIDPSQVYLIDDDERNCSMAVSSGYNAVIVPKEAAAGPEYLIGVSEIAKAPALLTSSHILVESTRAAALPEIQYFELIDLSNFMLPLQDAHGRDKASEFKQNLFRILQTDGFVPNGENIRSMSEYCSGKSCIRFANRVTKESYDRIFERATELYNQMTSLRQETWATRTSKSTEIKQSQGF